jgi:hypothetical protein
MRTIINIKKREDFFFFIVAGIAWISRIRERIGGERKNSTTAMNHHAYSIPLEAPPLNGAPAHGPSKLCAWCWKPVWPGICGLKANWNGCVHA